MKIKNRFNTILEFNAPTGTLNFDRFLNVPFQPDQMIIKYVSKHNITNPTNTGLASLFCNLPIKNNGKLFTIAQQNDIIDSELTFDLVKSDIVGNYIFYFVLSGANGLAALDADIAVFLEFLEHE
jgi:hypothetical protein